MNKTAIPWTDFTWTVSRGCSPISEGCANCYAAAMASRFSGPLGPYAGLARGGKWTGKIDLLPGNLDEPLKRKKPAKIFVNSMSDLFHENIELKMILLVFHRMAAARQHTFQLLTKRPSLMRKVFRWIETEDFGPLGEAIKEGRWPLPNIWVGATVENQAAADKRIPILLDTPAAVRFISIEPMLGPIQMADRWLGFGETEPADNRIDWVIVGCESGPRARPCEMDWIYDIKDQCHQAGIPIFIKQARPYAGELMKMPEIDGQIWDEYPGLL